MSSKVKVCIIGAESWGTAIATAVGDNAFDSDKFDQRVRIYVFEDYIGENKLADLINETHENIKYLPGIPLPKNLVAVSGLIETVEDADIIIFATPQNFVKPYCNLLAGNVKPTAIAVSLVKGFEHINDGEIHLFSQAISKQLGIPCYTLMSANCAMEMAQGKICELTIGCDNATHSELLKEIFQTTNCQVVSIDDVKGVELVGTLKDIIALGAGIVDGLRLGDNARVAVLHLGLKEMMRFVKGFYPTTKLSTFFEGCGVADLVASCYADKNVQFAKTFVTSGKTIQELEISSMNGKKLLGPLIAEEVAGFLAKQHMAEQFPLFTVVHKICQNEQPPESIIEAVRTHPDVNNLTISKLMQNEQAHKELTPCGFDLAEDIMYEPFSQHFFEDEQEAQAYQPLVQKAEKKKMPITHEMKPPATLNALESSNRSALGKTTLTKQKYNKKSNKFFMSHDDDDTKDKNDWTADNVWRPQDLSKIPKPQPTESPNPVEKDTEAKAELTADDFRQGNLFNESSSFQDLSMQLFDHYKPIHYVSDTVQSDNRQQVGHEDDFVTINVTAEFDDDKKGGKNDSYYGFSDLKNETETETEKSESDDASKSIETLKEAVQALDQLDDGQNLSSEELAAMYKKATEEQSLSTVHYWWNPMGESDQSAKAKKMPADKHLPEVAWHRTTDDENEINMPANETDVNLAKLIKPPEKRSNQLTDTWQPLGEAKEVVTASKGSDDNTFVHEKHETSSQDEALQEPENSAIKFTESTDHLLDSKEKFHLPDDLDRTTVKDEMHLSNPTEKPKQKELDAKTKMLSLTEVAAVMECPLEVAKNEDESLSNVIDDAKLYQDDARELLPKATTLNLSDKGTKQNYQQKSIKEIEAARREDEKARAAMTVEREASYWFQGDDIEPDEKKPAAQVVENKNETDDLLTKYFERNDEPGLAESTKYMDSKWGWQNDGDKKKELTGIEKNSALEEITRMETHQKPTTSASTMESSNENEVTAESKPAKSSRPTIFEEFTKRSMKKIFKAKSDRTEDIAALNESEAEMQAKEEAKEAKQLEDKEKKKKPEKDMLTDFESFWKSNLEKLPPETAGVENVDDVRATPPPIPPTKKLAKTKKKENESTKTARKLKSRKNSDISMSAKADTNFSKESADGGQRLSTKLTEKFERLNFYKKPRHEVKETISNVEYKGESPYSAEPRPSNRKPPFNPPFNPKVRIPRPPFDGREHEYHTFASHAPRLLAGPTAACAKSPRLRCMSKTWLATPRTKQFRSFFSALKLTRATKILCAIQFGVIAALLTNLGKD